jgi:predicted permease
MTTLLDLRFALRALRRAPGFSLVAISTLGLGIGGSITIFTVFNAALLRPLPYREPDRVVLLSEKRPAEDVFTLHVAPLDFVDWKERGRGLSGMAAHVDGLADLTGEAEPERVPTARVTANFFRVLGVEALHGRTFASGEDEPGPDRVVVVGYGVWQRRFGGDPGLVGRSIDLDGEAHVVTGILPPSFWFLDRDIELFRPLVLASEEMRTRSRHFLTVVARLEPGVSLDRAREEMDRVTRELEAEHPDTNEGHGAHVRTLREALTGEVRPALRLLLGGALFLLLIGCANVANLLLARGGGRLRELSIREFAGAGRGRLVAQLVTESLLLSFLAGFAGLLLASWSVETVPRLLSGDGRGPFPEELPLDGPVLLFALAASIVTALAFGVPPALQLTSRTRAHDVLKGSGRVTADGGFLRGALGSIETALALVLLVGAALLLKSFASVNAVAPGFRSEGSVTFRLSLPDSRYTGERRAAFFEELLERVRALPGIRSAGAVSFLPLAGDDWRSGIELEGRAADSDDGPTRAHVRFATPFYFQSLGIPLLEGRFIEAEDRADGLLVAVINETMARRYWPEERAVGRRVRFVGDESWRQVVGVVGDVKYWGLDRETNPEMYLPHSQFPFRSMAVVFRAEGAPESHLPAVRREVARLDASLPLSDVGTMEELLRDSLSSRRFNAVLLGIFAATALLLAAVGVSSVMAYTLSQRTREIGIRVALGAPARELVGMMLRQSFVITSAGVALGLAGALALSRLLRSLLYDVSPDDPAVLGAAAAFLFAVALLASYVPARRAMQVDPIAALRQE